MAKNNEQRSELEMTVGDEIFALEYVALRLNVLRGGLHKTLGGSDVEAWAEVADLVIAAEILAINRIGQELAGRLGNPEATFTPVEVELPVVHKYQAEEATEETE